MKKICEIKTAEINFNYDKDFLSDEFFDNCKIKPILKELHQKCYSIFNTYCDGINKMVKIIYNEELDRLLLLDYYYKSVNEFRLYVKEIEKIIANKKFDVKKVTICLVNDDREFQKMIKEHKIRNKNKKGMIYIGIIKIKWMDYLSNSIFREAEYFLLLAKNKLFKDGFRDPKKLKIMEDAYRKIKVNPHMDRADALTEAAGEIIVAHGDNYEYTTFPTFKHNKELFDNFRKIIDDLK